LGKSGERRSRIGLIGYWPYWASSKFCANGQPWSIHCSAQRKPVRSAMAETSEETIFVRAFRPDGFAGLEQDVQVGFADVHGLRGARAQMHFDALLPGIPARFVAELLTNENLRQVHD
jgi:hypothetical protein